MNFLTFLLIIAIYVAHCSACNGVGLRFSFIRNCANIDSLIKLNGVNITLDDNCILQSSGIRDISKDYKTAQVSIKMEKTGGRRLQSRLNACNSITNPLFSKVFSLLAIPTNCPVKKEKANLHSKEDINNLKKTLPILLGTTSVKIDVEHDKGVSCLEGNYVMYKK